MKHTNKVNKIKGLTDQQLISKYDTGEMINFEKGIKRMSKTPSPTTLSKQAKKKNNEFTN